MHNSSYQREERVQEVVSTNMLSALLKEGLD